MAIRGPISSFITIVFCLVLATLFILRMTVRHEISAGRVRNRFVNSQMPSVPDRFSLKARSSIVLPEIGCNSHRIVNHPAYSFVLQMEGVYEAHTNRSFRIVDPLSRRICGVRGTAAGSHRRSRPFNYLDPDLWSHRLLASRIP